MEVSTNQAEIPHLDWFLYSFGDKLLFKIEGKQIWGERSTSSNGSLAATELHCMGLARVSTCWQLPPASTGVAAWWPGPSSLCFQLPGYRRRQKNHSKSIPNIFYIYSAYCIPKRFCSWTEKVKRFSQSHTWIKAVSKWFTSAQCQSSLKILITAEIKLDFTTNNP